MSLPNPAEEPSDPRDQPRGDELRGASAPTKSGDEATDLAELPDPPEQAVDAFGFRRAAEKVRAFPRTPGVYLMKDWLAE